MVQLAQITRFQLLIGALAAGLLLFVLPVSSFTWFELGGVALAAILFTAYYIARIMKGKVGIELAKDGVKFPFYTTGEEIAGKVTIIIRKNLHMNRFFVALIGYEIVEGGGSEGGYATNEIYRREHNLAGVGILTAGTSHSFEFTLVVPGSNSPRAQEGQIPATDVR